VFAVNFSLDNFAAVEFDPHAGAYCSPYLSFALLHNLGVIHNQ
jgi:hypothetical protein